ncbi:MAG: DJ-1 family glyoxalase III [Ruminococcus sp.]
MYYCFLSEGFEEIEAIAAVDVLRRGGVEVKTVAVSSDNSKDIKGAHGITVFCDLAETEAETAGLEGIILPGGMPGTVNLEQSKTVQSFIDFAVANDLYIFAICAAPEILGHKGILKGKTSTCYPGFEQELKGAVLSESGVAADGKIITAKGPGRSIDFGLKIVETLKGAEVSSSLRESMQCPTSK